MENYHVPNYVTYILSEFEKSGYKAYLVGGCVRDLVMGKTPDDWDIAASALPEETEKLFKRAVPTGAKYGTVTVFYGRGKAEVTTFRSEKGYSDGRRPDNVHFVSTIEEDLSRRDFTVNSMAMDIRGNIIDLYGGLDDIERKIIRCVGDADARFSEDALRMMRAIRFSAKLGFTLCDNERDSIVKNARIMKNISAERIQTELVKTLLSAAPEKAALFIEYGLLDEYIDNNKICCLNKLINIKKEKFARISAFTGILLDKDIITDPYTFLKKLRFGNKFAEICGNACMIGTVKREYSDASIKKLLNRYGESSVLCACFVNKVIYGENTFNKVNSVIKSGQCWNIKMLAINGNDLKKLGIYGTAAGECLERLLDLVIESPHLNSKELLTEYASDFKSEIEKA